MAWFRNGKDKHPDATHPEPTDPELAGLDVTGLEAEEAAAAADGFAAPGQMVDPANPNDPDALDAGVDAGVDAGLGAAHLASPIEAEREPEPMLRSPADLPLIGDDGAPALGEIIGPPPLGHLDAAPPDPTGAPAPVVLPPESGPDQTCPNCSETAPFDARFCEACGSDLDPTAAAAPAAAPVAAAPDPGPVATEPCVSCDADPSEIDHGYCGACGTKQPSPRDHIEQDHGWYAAVTDRGISHHQNEDAMSVGSVDDSVILVVCDGVSSTDRPEEASQMAADLVRDHIAHALESGADLEQALLDAFESAHDRISALDHATGTEPPSCTVVAAIAVPADDATIRTTYGWLGDSRAYWIQGDTVAQLTADHSWAADQEQLGLLDAETIAADPRAHSITRWLGADLEDLDADIGTHQAPASGGRLLLCTDGLWNYAETSAEMARQVAESPGPPIVSARALTTFANNAGGRDNITIAIADFSAEKTPPEPTSLTTEEQGGTQ